MKSERWEGSLCCCEECQGGEYWKETFWGWEGLGREEEGDLRGLEMGNPVRGSTTGCEGGFELAVDSLNYSV
jgi:hypothetical protein